MPVSTDIFESLGGLTLSAEDLVKAYYSFINGPLDEMTDTRSSPKRVIEMRSLRTHAQRYAQLARQVTGDAKFNQLAPELQRDITAIAEEAEAAITEIDEYADSDKLWAKLPKQHKDDAVQTVRIDETAVAGIKQRLRHEKRVKPPKKHPVSPDYTGVPVTDPMATATPPEPPPDPKKKAKKQ